MLGARRHEFHPLLHDRFLLTVGGLSGRIVGFGSFGFGSFGLGGFGLGLFGLGILSRDAMPGTKSQRDSKQHHNRIRLELHHHSS